MKADARHKMKRDEFVSILGRVTHAIAENPKQALTVVIVVAAIGALFSGLVMYRNYQNTKANELFQHGLTSFYGTREDSPPDATRKPDYAAALANFNQVSGFNMSELKEPARLMAAVCEARLGKTSDAQNRLNSLASSGRSDFFTRMAKLVEAETLYQQGKYADAARVYAELTQTNDPNFPADYTLLAAGIAQEKAGDRLSALVTFKKLKAQFPSSSYNQAADAEIRRIAPDQSEE